MVNAPLDCLRGAARVLEPGRDDVTRFEQPARGPVGRAAMVVQPADLDQVREVVRRAVANRIRLLPQGANTGLVGASVPPTDGPGVVLSTDRLNPDPRIDTVSRTALVGAGARLSAVNDAAGRHGLHLPVDLAADPAIGGMIATNTGGNRMVRYGPMRRYVLGVEVVAADAEASVYGRLTGVRKDSRGVDAVAMAVGSGGALGVITAAVLALVPVPERIETWWLAVDDPDRVVELFAHLDSGQPGTISGFEFVARAAMERALDAPGARANPFGATVPAAAVLAEWSFAAATGPAAAAATVDAQTGTAGTDPTDAAASIAAQLQAAADLGLLSDGRQVDPTAAWALRHGVSDSLRRLGVVLGHDVAAPLGAVMVMRAAAITAVGRVDPDAVVCDFGHVGDGGLHLNVLFPAAVGAPSADRVAAIRLAIDAVVADHGGSYSAEHGLGPVNAERWLADTPPVEQHMIAALKSVVDPAAILGHPGHPYNRIAPNPG